MPKFLTGISFINPHGDEVIVNGDWAPISDEDPVIWRGIDNNRFEVTGEPEGSYDVVNLRYMTRANRLIDDAIAVLDEKISSVESENIVLKNSESSQTIVTEIKYESDISSSMDLVNKRYADDYGIIPFSYSRVTQFEKFPNQTALNNFSCLLTDWGDGTYEVGTISAHTYNSSDLYNGCFYFGTKLGPAVFERCVGLKEITIPNKFSVISSRLLEGCGLQHVTLGNNVSRIESKAFYGCRGLRYILLNTEIPPQLVADALSVTNNCTIYVPNADRYKNANVWKNYADRIKNISELGG